jgi:site-specific DNA recombinase
MQHVGLYCRISEDKNAHREGVDEQERWGRAYAASAWPDLPVVVYCDNDITAARDDVVRPRFEYLRQAIRDGEAVQLLATWQSRLDRTYGWFGFASETVAAGVTELHTRHEGIVRLDDVVAGLRAVLNRDEVVKLKKRVNDSLDDRARRGVAPGSRPFGYRHAVTSDGVKTYVIVPEEAEAIRWAAEWVPSGWSLASVAAELCRRGLKGPHRVKVRDAYGEVVLDDRGQPVTRETALTAGSVRSMLTSPTIAGYRVHRGQIVGRGNWEAILDEKTWRACRARLSAPRMVDRSDGRAYPVTTSHTGFRGRRYALTGGLAVCGVCGARLLGQVLQAANGKPYLVCSRRKNGDEKGAHVGIMLEATEAFVVDQLFAELDKPEFLAAIAADDHAERRSEIMDSLEHIEAQRNELAKMWGTPGGLTSAEWQAARQALNDTERQLQAELDEKQPPPQVADIGRVRATWPYLDLGEQRAFLRLFIDRVVIMKATPGRKGFDPNRLVIHFVGDVADVDTECYHEGRELE